MALKEEMQPKHTALPSEEIKPAQLSQIRCTTYTINIFFKNLRIAQIHDYLPLVMPTSKTIWFKLQQSNRKVKHLEINCWKI